MAIEPAEVVTKPAQRTVFVDTFTDGLLGPEVHMARPGRRRRPHRLELDAGLLGADDHAVDPRRPRGLHAGRGGGRRDRRRDRDPDQGDRRDLAGDLVGQRPADGGPVRRRPLLRAGVPGLRDASGRRRASRASGRSRCAAPNCGADATPFTFTNGYTIAFDEMHTVGVTVPREAAEGFARDAARFAALPDSSVQNPILGFAPHDLVGAGHAVRPFLGQIGTSPSITIPDSHNAGDFGSFLIGAPHRYALDRAGAAGHKTDGHMDIDAVRAGAILVCPVKLDGAGVYLGDMHALQGDGEIAGHTCDVAGTVTLAGRGAQGPRDRRPAPVPGGRGPAVPGPAADRRASASRALALGRRYGVERARGVAADLGRSAPAPTSTRATDNGLARAAELLDMSVPEVLQPGDDHGRDRDRPPPRRRPGHVPRTGRSAEGARPGGLRGRAVP